MTTWTALPDQIRLYILEQLALPDAIALSTARKDAALIAQIRQRIRNLKPIRDAWVHATQPALRMFANPPHLRTVSARSALSASDFSQLTCLPLSGSGLRDLSAIGECRQLCVLDVSRNHLQHVHPSMVTCRKLKVLHLGRNNLKHFPHVVLQLPELRTLLLHHNPISTLPEDWSALPKLTRLGLSDCAIRGDLPEQLCSILGTVTERRRRSADFQKNRLDADRICLQFRKFPLLKFAIVI